MYLHHWGLRERPFQNTYDPAYLYRWEGHDEVLSRLRYTLDGGRGLALVTGPTGCGKSFLCRSFAEGASSKGTRLCLIVNPVDDPDEILRQVQAGLGVEPAAESTGDQIRSIERAAVETHRRGERTLVVIDDAHLLTNPRVPRVLRNLLNLEEGGAALINLVLSGQEEIEVAVRGSDPLAQRVAIRTRAEPLPPEEVGGYVAYRLKVAGRPKNPFKANAIREIASATRGIPRAINDLCDVVLFTAWGQGKRQIAAEDVEEAVGDIVPAEG